MPCNHRADLERAQYGIFDTVANCWMGGGDDGPKAFPEKDLAAIAAQIVACQLSHPVIRYEAREIPKGPWRFKDEIPTRMTPLEALKRIEMGYV